MVAPRLWFRIIPWAVGAVLALFGTVVLLRVNSKATPQLLPGPPEPNAAPSPIVTRRISANRWVVSKKDRDGYLANLVGATRQITLKPNPGKEPESVADLTVFKLAEESPMYAAGFRKDDRIMKVNGTPIRTMNRAVNLVHEIKACNRLTVQVQRDDQLIDYQFDFE